MSRQGEARPRTLTNVRNFWDEEAREWGENPQVTIRDHYFRLLCLDLIAEVVRGRAKALDIGCGTGFSTLFYAQCVKEIVGADYSNEMIRWARRFLHDPDYYERTMAHFAPDRRPAIPGNARFEVGDILRIDYPDRAFDAVITERVLVNLTEREMQDEAVREIARVLGSGGLWVVAEASEQGHERIDRLRTAFGLRAIEKYWHNLYLDEPRFERVAGEAGFEVSPMRVFETYQFLTKIVHPLLVRPAEPQFLAGFNRAAGIVSRRYPSYESIRAVGIESFLTREFRPLLVDHDPGKLAAFDAVVSAIVAADPDLTMGSHQVMYVLIKR